MDRSRVTPAAASRRVAKGLFVAVVGPSGAGKDTLINGLRDCLGEADGVFYARRVVTRQSDVFEDHETLAESDFLRARDEGSFALSWPAHGLHYGVPVQVDDWIARGGAVVCNVSRAVVADVRRRYSNHLVVLVTAKPGDARGAPRRARARERREPAQPARPLLLAGYSPSMRTPSSPTTAPSRTPSHNCAI